METHHPGRIVRDIAVGGLMLIAIAIAIESAFASYKTPLDFALSPLETATETTLLVVGNSHTGALGRLPLRDDDVTYNASVGGQDIYRSYLLLREYVPKLPRLREVIMALDYDAIGYNLSVFNQDWQDRQYYPYTKVLYHDGFVERQLARSAFFRANRDFSALLSSRENGAAPLMPMLPVAGAGKGVLPACQKRAREQSEVKFRESLIAENSLVLQKTLALIDEHKVQIHFVNLPKADCYREAYSRATRPLAQTAILRALGERRSLFQDYFDFGPGATDDFLDADHLSPLGSVKVMKDLSARTAPRPLAK